MFEFADSINWGVIEFKFICLEKMRLEKADTGMQPLHVTNKCTGCMWLVGAELNSV